MHGAGRIFERSNIRSVGGADHELGHLGIAFTRAVQSSS